MITNYNNYINKKSLNEKLEIDISEKIDDISGMVLHSFDKVKNKIFLENTSDGFEINEEDTYYTIAEFKLSDKQKENTEDKLLPAKESINGKIFWIGIKLNDKKQISYGYEVVASDVGLYGGDILKEINNIIIIQSNTEKLKPGRINGFYLYKKKLPIEPILDSYGFKYDSKNVEEAKDVGESPTTINYEVGKIYNVVNSKGENVNLIIRSNKDGIITAYDIDNNQPIANQKQKNLKDAKEVDTYKYLNPRVQALKMSEWKKSDSFKNTVKSKDKKAIASIFKKKLTTLYAIDDIVGDILHRIKDKDSSEWSAYERLKTSLSNIEGYIIRGAQKDYNIDLSKVRGDKKDTSETEPEQKQQGTLDLKDGETNKTDTPTDNDPNSTEKPDTNVDSPEAQKTVDDLKAQEDKSAPLKAQPKPIVKKKEKPKGIPQPQKVKEEELIQAESKKHKE